MRGLILGEILRRSARPDTFGGKVALIQGDTRITYAELNASANRVANALLALGVCRGDRVAVLGRNSADYVAIVFGLARTGAIIVPLNVWHQGDEIVYAITQSGCRFFLLEASFSGLVTSVKAKLDRVERYVEFGRDAAAPALASLMAQVSPAEPTVTVDETDARVIMYTSGTTGFPKGATLSHRRHRLPAGAVLPRRRDRDRGRAARRR